MARARSGSVKSVTRTDGNRVPISNKILAALPDSEFHLIRAHLKFMDLPSHLRLQEPAKKIEHAYFPNSGMISLVVVMKNGKTVEVGVVGREGFTGTPLAVALDVSPVREVVQVAGRGFQVRASVLRRVLRSAPQLDSLLSRFSVLLGMQMAQTAACNRLHDVERRLSRWLLLTEDRVQEDYLAITHDFLAAMLGTDRPSLSLAAGRLQKKGLIEYKRAAVKILSRTGLEAAACECYAVIRRFNRQLGLSEEVGDSGGC
jgi:CRP-like cAMP-binding protein